MGEENFEPPRSKREIIDLLYAENQAFVFLALQQVIGLNREALHPPQQQTRPKIVKLPDFYDQDTNKWFEPADQFLADCPPDQVRKNSILRVIPMDIQTESGIELNASYESIKQRIISHCDDYQDQSCF